MTVLNETKRYKHHREDHSRENCCPKAEGFHHDPKNHTVEAMSLPQGNKGLHERHNSIIEKDHSYK